MKTLQVTISHDQRHQHDQEIFVNKMAVSTWQLNIRIILIYSLKCLNIFCLLEDHASVKNFSPKQRPNQVAPVDNIHYRLAPSLVDRKSGTVYVL